MYSNEFTKHNAAVISNSLLSDQQEMYPLLIGLFLFLILYGITLDWARVPDQHKKTKLLS